MQASPGPVARLFAGAWLIGLPAALHAQSVEILPADRPQFDSSRYTAVLERRQPALDPLGILLPGGWKLSPSVTTQAIADDNVYGTERGREGDFIARLQPDLTLQSGWGRHSLTLHAGATIDRFARHPKENVENFDLSTMGRLDLGHDTTVRGGLRYIDAHLSRQSVDLFGQPLRPVHFRQLTAAAAASHDIGRLRLSTDVTYVHRNYDNGRFADGSVYLQDPNDNDIYRVGIRASYAPSASIAAFLRALGDWRDFKTGTPTTPIRSSQGYQLLGGLQFEPSALIRGQIGVGYIRQDFRDGRYRPVSGTAFNADVQFFPSQLTTVSVRADRQVLDSGIPGSGGYLATTVAVNVDHELLRQLILSASAGLEQDRFNSIDRRDRRLTTTARAVYRANRMLAFEARYERVHLGSDGADRFRSFTDNRLTIGLTLRK